MRRFHLIDSMARRRHELWHALLDERGARDSRLTIALRAVADLGRGWVNLRAIGDACWLARSKR